MILCMNPNAAIDKTVIVSSFQLGHIHRPNAVKSLPGGKGCNVARGLKRLGAKPVVSGWVGGSAGQFIEQGLHQEGIQTDFVHTDFESRTCLSILDEGNQVMTEIYEHGDAVPSAQIAAMRDHFRSIIAKYDAVTFSGSLPPGVPLTFYRELITIAQEAGVPTFLDSSRDALAHGIEAKPYLIKPNEDEVVALTGHTLHTVADYAAAAAAISTRHDTIVVLSLGAAGAIGAQGTNVLRAQTPAVSAKSAVGSGDCMLAGLAFGFLHQLSFEDMLKHGVAAGTANTLHIGAGNFTLTDFQQVKEQVRITQFEVR